MTGLEDLYRRYAQDVFRFAFWLGGDRSEAEDVTSETFVRAWIGGGRLRPNTVKAYLIAIARNVFLQRRRQSKKYREMDEDLPDPGPGPETTVEWRDELREVTEALQTLNEIERSALIMRAEFDLPYEEVARALGMSVSAVKVRVHRARLKLIRRRIERERGAL